MRLFLGLGAVSLLAAGCLLVTSLDGLEGPPIAGASGAGASGSASVNDAEAQDGSRDVSSTEATAGTLMLFRDRKNGGSPRGIALSQDGVYWAEAPPNVGILYAPKVGSSAPVHVEVLMDLLTDVFDVGVDGVFLYWTEYTKGVVRYRPLAGGNVATDYFAGAGHAAYLAMADNGRLLLTDNNLSTAVVVYGPPSISVANDQKPPATGIAFCNSIAYWAYGQASTDDASIDDASMNGAAIATADTSGTVRNDRFYVPPSPVTITGIACDDSNLYWIENGQSIRWIDLVQKVANPPLYSTDTKFESGSNVGDIAVDANGIYFTDPQNRAIYHLAKPPAHDR